MHGDTIVAPATSRGKAALAIVRLSGPEAHDALARLARAPFPADRRLRLRRLHDQESGALLDEALVVAFPGESSPTGELAAEAHLHGGPAVVAGVLRALESLPGVRLARPGEFSQRALRNGRLDLTQLEGVADLIDAETEAQRRQAAALMQGELSEAVARWRGALIEALALIEASIDFTDEDDIPTEALSLAKARMAPLISELSRAVEGARGAALTREGFEVAVIGPPNAGKSSLVNRIAGREIALTSPLAGTTRDALEVRCEIGGQLVTIVDTAGQRDTADELEALGVAHARRRARAAHLRLVVSAPDATERPSCEDGDILVWNKCDLGRGDGLNVSARTGEGLDGLLNAVATALASRSAEDGLLGRARHIECVAGALGHVRSALSAAPEIAAEELRLAAQALDVLIGRVDPEHVLDEIFSRFCLGK